MTPDQKDELLAKMAEALRGILPAVSQFSEAHGFATQVLNAYDAAMKPGLEPGWYVVQWRKGNSLDCGAFLGGNWYRAGAHGHTLRPPHRIIRRIELEG